jgi:DNA topoisomerase-2
MVLVNGAEGIGTGWSTSVPNYNPRELVSALREKLEGGSDFPLFTPYYKGFDGRIYQEEKGYGVEGVIEHFGEEIHVKELPI